MIPFKKIKLQVIGRGKSIIIIVIIIITIYT